MKDKVTLLIKTFNRPESLKRLYDSIRKFYKHLNIIVVDDGEFCIDPKVFDNNVNYVKTQFDIGASAGRNLGIKNINTKYFITLDDDFLFSKKTKIENFISVMENNPDFDLISGLVRGKRIFTGNMIFSENNTVLRLVEPSKKIRPLQEVDIVPQFFIAKTKKFINTGGWNEKLKTNEHWDLFVKLKKKNIKVGIYDMVNVAHKSNKPKNYIKYRKRSYTHLALKENGLKKIIKFK